MDVQIAKKLVSCTWRKLWFSCWNDRAKNIGITYPANSIAVQRFRDQKSNPESRFQRETCERLHKALGLPS